MKVIDIGDVPRDIANWIETLNGCESASTRPGHKHAKEDVELGMSLCRAAYIEETKSV